MLGSPILDVAIGLAMIYLLLSLICTAVNEWVAGLWNWRAETLKDALRKLLDAPPDGSYQIRNVDIKDGRGLLQSLKDTGQPGATIRAKLSAEALAQLDAHDAEQPASPALINQVVAGLNSLIEGPLLQPDLFGDRLQAVTRAKAGAAVSKGATAPSPASQNLNRAMLQQYFSDSIASLSDLFYDHPLIKSLENTRGMLPRIVARFRKVGGDRHPSYIPGTRFSTALIDVVSQYAGRAEDFKTALDHMPDSDVRRSLAAITRHGDQNPQEIQKRVESWFDETMQRVSGKYKRKTQLATMIIAAAVTLVMNADTVHIAHKLWVSPTLRTVAIDAAKARVERGEATQELQYDPDNPGAAAKLVSLENNPLLTSHEQDLMTQVMGWSSDRAGLKAVLEPTDGSPPASLFQARWGWVFFTLLPNHFVGWFATMIAISLGAPFWFDTLNKFMNIRSSGKKPEELAKTK